MIKAVNIVKKYGNKIVLTDINLFISRGQFITVLGPNGAGKSTLLRLLSMMTKPSGGQVLIDGVSGKDSPLSLRKKIGVLSHNSFLYGGLTARENLKFYGKLYDVPDLRQRIDQVIEEVGLQYDMSDPVNTFSRGMLQRLAIARAIIHDPEILFLDEPYTGLDRHAVEILNNVLFNLNRKDRTIFMITHNFEQGLAHSDRILMLVKGKIVYDEIVTGFDEGLFKDIYLSNVGEAR